MKMNKKGFTLIEMLVVIAIIAVLVSIIVPTVSNSTVKASAATNAANLRSYASEVAIVYINPGDATVAVDANSKAITITAGTETKAPKAPEAKKVGSIFTFTDAPEAKAYLVDGEVVASYGSSATDKDIEYFAYIAENGKAKQ